MTEITALAAVSNQIDYELAAYGAARPDASGRT